MQRQGQAARRQDQAEQGPEASGDVQVGAVETTHTSPLMKKMVEDHLDLSVVAAVRLLGDVHAAAMPDHQGHPTRGGEPANASSRMHFWGKFCTPT